MGRLGRLISGPRGVLCKWCSRGSDPASAPVQASFGSPFFFLPITFRGRINLHTFTQANARHFPRYVFQLQNTSRYSFVIGGLDLFGFQWFPMGGKIMGCQSWLGLERRRDRSPSTSTTCTAPLANPKSTYLITPITATPI